MTTLNITTLKMIIAVVGALTFLTIFSATSQYQEVSFKACAASNNTQAVNTVSFNCLPYNNSQTDKNG